MADIDVFNDGTNQTGTAASDTFLVFGDQTVAKTLNGSGGIDTFEAQGAIEIASNITLTDIENLALDTFDFTITAADMVVFDRIVADDGANEGNLTFSLGGVFTSTIVTQLTTLDVTGSAGNDLVSLTTEALGTQTDITFNAGAGADSVTTGGGDDVVNGSTGNDVLNGGAGDDLLNGGSELDTLNGGSGDDTLDFGSGDDVDGGTDNDLLRATGSLLLAATLDGDTGLDTFEAQGAVTIGAAVTLVGIENLALDSSNLTLTATHLGQFTTIEADSFASTGLITLSSGGSATTDVTELATLTVNGSSAADTLTFTTSGAVVTDITVDAEAGADIINTGSGADTLNGGDGNDSLDGNAGADTLNGDAGDDTLDVRNGDDANGGADNDLLRVFESLTVAATLNGGTGIDTFEAQAPITVGAAVVLTGIENLALDASLLTLTAAQLAQFTTINQDAGAALGRLGLSSGGIFADTQVVGLADLDVTGSAQGDSLRFVTGATDITVAAGDGNDSITTGAGDDVLDGAAGDDTLNGFSGDDIIIGGAGIDTASYNDVAGAVTVSLAIVAAQNTGAGGIDTISQTENLFGTAFSDTLTGDGADNLLNGGAGNGNDTLIGGAGNDTLIGGGGDDTLVGSGGKDLLEGGIGNDTLNGGGAKDTATYAAAGAGVTVDLDIAGFQNTVGAGFDSLLAVDNLTGSGFADTLNGSAGDNFLRGGGGNDTLIGRGGGDTIRGDDNDDFIDGGANADQIQGGAGNDVIIGGTGNDVMRGNSGSDEFLFRAGDNFDTIEDFDDNVDELSFSGFGLAFDSEAEIIGAAAQVGADVRITLPNGGGGGVTTVVMLGFNLADLDAADFGTIIA